MDKITFIITSSNRIDLLEKTIDSFLELNTYPIYQFILNEDSGNKDCYNQIINKYSDRFKIIFNPCRNGLAKSLDNLLKLVETEYVFTSEDDWKFEGNPNFISDSLKILQQYPTINHVWIRNPADHSHPLGEIKNYAGIPARIVLKGYQKHWGGFSFNPGLKRVSDFKKYFPNGLSEHGDEIECSKHVESLGYMAVSLVNYSIIHIGWDRHTENFKI